MIVQPQQEQIAQLQRVVEHQFASRWRRTRTVGQDGGLGDMEHPAPTEDDLSDLGLGASMVVSLGQEC